jgi:hypothetical protein
MNDHRKEQLSHAMNSIASAEDLLGDAWTSGNEDRIDEMLAKVTKARDTLTFAICKIHLSNDCGHRALAEIQTNQMSGIKIKTTESDLN